MKLELLLGTLLFLHGAASAAELYAVSVVPQAAQTSDAYVFHVDAAQRRLSQGLKLASDPAIVLVDSERSVVATASPSIAPTEVEILDMDHPGDSRVIDLGYRPSELLPTSIFEVDEPGRGVFLAFALGRVWTEEKLWPKFLTAVPLQPLGSQLQNLPLGEVAHVRSMGLVGDRFREAQTLVPEVVGNPLRVTLKDAGASTAIPAPPRGASTASADQIFYDLVVSNDELAVVAPQAASKVSGFHVFDKKAQRWQVIAPRFPCLFVRAFGYWLAFMASESAAGSRMVVPGTGGTSVMAAPGGYHAGSAQKRSSEVTAYRSTVESELQAAGHNLPGKLLLWSQKTGAEYEINTGEADSEVVYVNDQFVVIRVNDELRQASFVEGKLQAFGQIAIGPEVVGVHWMFEGPVR